MALAGAHLLSDHRPTAAPAALPTTAPPPRPPALSSNNPFRNRASPSPRALEPSLPKPAMSTNPFLDAGDYALRSAPAPVIPDDIFSDLSLLDKPASHRVAPPPPSTRNGTRPGAIPPSAAAEQRRIPPRPLRDESKPSARPTHRPRRASESSIMEKDRRPLERPERRERTESEERRRRERRREREERHRREGKDPSSRKGDKVKKPKGLDIIDKLDVTGIYGPGLFHHDGPFDACNPHRNTKRDRRAPIQAFPVGSANMALGGSGPLKSGLDLDTFHGRGQEGFSEYASARKAEASVIESTARVEPVHGEESYGLGTSTFLEGAPASKKDLQRRDSDEGAVEQASGGGLSRKKSLAQRFRGMSGSRRAGSSDLRSPEGRYYVGAAVTHERDDSPPHLKATSAGGLPRAYYNKENEINPFDNDYEAAFDKKTTQIRIAEQERPRTATSPQEGSAGLARAHTNDGSSSTGDERPPNSGFLNRMKSLKGGPRRVRRET